MTDPVTHYVFVDFENVPKVDLSVLGDVPAVVTIFLGQKSKLKPDLVEQITKRPCEVRLIKVGVTNKNALDFVLTYHLGATMARHPGGRYYIIAKDRDYASIIKHLALSGVFITKHDNLEELPFLPTPQKPVGEAKAAPSSKKPPVNRHVKIITTLLDPNNRTPPTTEKRLNAYIKTGLGKESTDTKIAEIVDELKQRGVTIDGKGRVAYPR
jgi:hypothetical protein